MPQVIIENPIVNSPFAEPSRHFRFTDEGITDEIVASRRISSYFVPIPRAKTLEEMPAVVSYVKNHHLGFTIPYTIDGEEHHPSSRGSCDTSIAHSEGNRRQQSNKQRRRLPPNDE